MHAPRFWREAIIEAERPLFTTARFDQFPDPPSPAAHAKGFGFIL
jgi:hypothetical protein